MKQLFSDTVSKDLANGYIRKLNPGEIPSTGWLLPEHGLMHPHKPGKLRRVSNARSKYRGVCLNDMLITGPDLLANLLGVLIRFRERKYPLQTSKRCLYKYLYDLPIENFCDFFGALKTQTFMSTSGSSLEPPKYLTKPPKNQNGNASDIL